MSNQPRKILVKKKHGSYIPILITDKLTIIDVDGKTNVC